MSHYLSSLDDYDIIQQIYEFGLDAEKRRFIEFFMATKLQRWWREVRSRKRRQNTVEAARTVGRFLATLKAKKAMMRKIKSTVHQDQRRYFDSKIVKFQALWRGYASRKNVFSYYQRKSDLKVKQLCALCLTRLFKNLEIINEKTLRNLDQYKILLKLQEAETAMERSKIKPECTKVQKPSYEPVNYITCTSTKIVDAKNLNHTKKRCKIIPTCMINVFEKKEKKAAVQLKPVQPRGRPKGPFRSEQAVDAQKSRPSSPTLRVATPFDLQEESKRFEKKMKRITRIQDPMVHSVSNFGL